MAGIVQGPIRTAAANGACRDGGSFRGRTIGRYFNREITRATRWFASNPALPPQPGRRRGVRPISFCIPAEQIIDATPTKEKDFASHVVDPEMLGQLGSATTYAFTDGASYYSDLRRSRFGITTKRAGWDALRHYEIAASATVPCFRDLDRKPPLCAPRGLDDTNCLSSGDADDLFDQVQSISDAPNAELQAGALAWACASSTLVRAAEFLDACGVRPAGKRPPAAHTACP